MLTLEYEQTILQDGKFSRVIGIDEVGRGAWAGPVGVGAFMVDVNSPQVSNVTDSKKLTPKQRQETYKGLSVQSYTVAYKSAEEIDQVGIGKAIQQLILELIQQYDDEQTFFLVDGKFAAKFKSNVEVIVRGDSVSYAIAAASILAKVERDHLMVQLDKTHPGYEFGRHKGYGTKLHQELLQQNGVSEVHRKSYKPVQHRLNI